MSAVPIKVSEILGLLKAGKTRDEIAEMYNLNGVQLKELFKHPKLKNKKTVKEKGVPFILVDDTEGDVVEDAVKAAASADIIEEVTAKVEEVEAPIEVATETVVEQPAEVQVTDQAANTAAEQVAPAPETEGSLWGND